MANLPIPTTVGAVIPALVTMFGQIANVFVKDGPGPAEIIGGDVIFVGIPDASGEAVRHQLNHDGRYDDGSTEAYDVICMVGSWLRDGELSARRDRCVDLLAQIAAKLEAAFGRTGALVGLCDSAWFGNRMSWLPKPGTKGNLYTVGFSIHVTASIA